MQNITQKTYIHACNIVFVNKAKGNQIAMVVPYWIHEHCSCIYYFDKDLAIHLCANL